MNISFRNVYSLYQRKNIDNNRLMSNKVLKKSYTETFMNDLDVEYSLKQMADLSLKRNILNSIITYLALFKSHKAV